MYQDTFNQLINQRVFHYNNLIVKSESILKCLKIVLDDKIKMGHENLSLYRLKSLSQILTIKNADLDHLVKTNDKDEAIYILENQIKKYTKDAVELIKEIVKTGRIKTN